MEEYNPFDPFILAYRAINMFEFGEMVDVYALSGGVLAFFFAFA